MVAYFTRLRFGHGLAEVVDLPSGKLPTGGHPKLVVYAVLKLELLPGSFGVLQGQIQVSYPEPNVILGDAFSRLRQANLLILNLVLPFVHRWQLKRLVDADGVKFSAGAVGEHIQVWNRIRSFEQLTTLANTQISRPDRRTVGQNPVNDLCFGERPLPQRIQGRSPDY